MTDHLVLQINICKAADPSIGSGGNQAAALVTSASGGISIMDEAASGQQVSSMCQHALGMPAAKVLLLWSNINLFETCMKWLLDHCMASYHAECHV